MDKRTCDPTKLAAKFTTDAQKNARINKLIRMNSNLYKKKYAIDIKIFSHLKEIRLHKEALGQEVVKEVEEVKWNPDNRRYE